MVTAAGSAYTVATQAPAPLPVVVVGAGPTGVTVATLLATYGVPSLVVDRWPGVYPQPRAVHLDDEVYRILVRMGVDEAFDAISRPSLGLRLVDTDLRVLAEFDRSGSAPSNGHPRASMFDQPELEALLRRNLDSHPAVTLRGDVEVLDLDQHPDRVRVHLRDRTTGVEESLEARYVLGCDGANSMVRERIGVEYEDLDFDQRWLVVDIETRADLQQWEGVHQVCDTRRAATYMRVGATRYRWEFQLLEDECAADFAGIDDLVPLLAPWTGRAVPADLEVVRVGEYTFRAAIAARWRSRRVFLLGDAAHLTPPFIGQGMGAGMRDAANLAWRLAGVLGGSLPDSVLDGYERERRPHARAMIQLARATGIVMTGGGALGDLARRHVLPRIATLPVVRAALTDSTTPPLEVRPRTEAVTRADGLVGQLAPSLPVGPGAPRLDVLVGPEWSVVTRTPLAPTEAEALAGMGCRPVVVERESGLGRWLEDARAEAVLVRPDRTVHSSHREPSMITAAAIAALAHGHI